MGQPNRLLSAGFELWVDHLKLIRGRDRVKSVSWLIRFCNGTGIAI